jgi:carbamoyl-phosphate synthase large subunit
MRIFITGAGGAAAVSVWKSLGQAHELHMADMDTCATGLYLVGAKQRALLPRGDDAGFVDRLLQICIERRIELLIPTVDAELLPVAKARQNFERHGVRVALPSAALLQLTRDKDQLLRYCEGAIPVPRSQIWHPGVQAASFNFPVFAKPRAGSGSRDLHLLESAQALEQLPRDGSFLVQEWLPGDEYSIDTYVTQAGDVIAAVPRVRMKTDSGIAVTARTVHHQDVIDIAVAFVKHIGLRFVGNVQLRRAADGTPKLLEINARFPGTLPLTAAAGVDIPKLMVDDIMGKPMPTTLLPFTETMVVRYWTEHITTPREWEALRDEKARAQANLSSALNKTGSTALTA